jgi:plasmid stability protein
VSKTLQIRDVPDDVHAALHARAAEQRMTVSGYLLRHLTELARRPTNAELMDRARQLARAGGGTSNTEVVAAVREARDR